MARRSFHFYECHIIEKLLKSGIMQMAMRIFFQALSIFDGSMDQLQRFLEDSKNHSTSIYDFDLSINDDQELSKGKSFLLSLFCLTHGNKVFSSDSPENFMKDHPELAKIWNLHEKYIRKLFLRILQIGDSNFHGICGWSMKKYENQFPQMIGIGCYPFISLVNHSCAPNVNRIYVDDKMILLVERPIKKGEQLFDCYKQVDIKFIT